MSKNNSNDLTMSEAAIECRREYRRRSAREWRKKNREKVNAYKREWSRKNPDKVKLYQVRYWERKAAQGESGQHEETDCSYKRGVDRAYQERGRSAGEHRTTL